MSKLFVVTISYNDGYDRDFDVKTVEVPNTETVETVQSVFNLATETYEPENKYKVYLLSEWLKTSLYDDWKTLKTEISRNAEKHKKIQELQDKIENTVRDIFHLQDGIGDYPDPDAQIKKWEEDIECYQQKIDELMGTNEI